MSASPRDDLVSAVRVQLDRAWKYGLDTAGRKPEDVIIDAAVRYAASEVNRILSDPAYAEARQRLAAATAERTARQP